MNSYALTLSLGLLTSLLLSDTLQITAGGIIVPGYIAYVLDKPVLLAMTIGTGLLTYLLLIGIGRVTILYGRRLFVAALLIGFFCAMIVQLIHRHYFPNQAPGQEYGWVVPGLLALWLYRQGALVTFSALIIAVVTTALAVRCLQLAGV